MKVDVSKFLKLYTLVMIKKDQLMQKFTKKMGEGFPFFPDPTQVQSLARLNIIETWAVQFVTPSHKWPFTFKLITIKNSVPQWQQPYSRAQQPYVASGYHTGQCRLQNICVIRESSLSQTLQGLGGYHSFIKHLSKHLRSLLAIC